MVGHGEVVPARTLPTLHPPSPIPSHCASIVTTSTLRVKQYQLQLCLWAGLSDVDRSVVITLSHGTFMDPAAGERSNLQ